MLTVIDQKLGIHCNSNMANVGFISIAWVKIQLAVDRDRKSWEDVAVGIIQNVVADIGDSGPVQDTLGANLWRKFFVRKLKDARNDFQWDH